MPFPLPLETLLGKPLMYVLFGLIGFFFGYVLEISGFGESTKLANQFYFKDMTVLKVMFTAVVTAMLGLSYAFALGWIAPEQVYALPTVYRAQIVGGLLFGVGFVVSGWCPGTGAVGAACGKWDAVVFLLGTAIGAAMFEAGHRTKLTKLGVSRYGASGKPSELYKMLGLDAGSIAAKIETLLE